MGHKLRVGCRQVENTIDIRKGFSWVGRVEGW